MNINKALKTKNLLVKEISKLAQKIQTYNSSTVGELNPYNTKNILTEYRAKTTELVALKTAINKANLPIQETIYQISELKSVVSQLRMVPTKAGKVVGRFTGSEAIEYVAQISTLELEELLNNLEKEIEELQEKIDKFNYTTEI